MDFFFMKKLFLKSTLHPNTANQSAGDRGLKTWPSQDKMKKISLHLIQHLRSKTGSAFKLIKNVHGVGYKLEE